MNLQPVRNRLFLRVFIDAQVSQFTFFIGLFDNVEERAKLESEIKSVFRDTSENITMTNKFGEQLVLLRSLVFGYHTYAAASVDSGVKHE